MKIRSSRAPRSPASPASGANQRAAQNVRDLEQRIDTLQQLDDDALGRFTRIDWWALLIAAVLLPIVAFVAAA